MVRARGTASAKAQGWLMPRVLVERGGQSGWGSGQGREKEGVWPGRPWAEGSTRRAARKPPASPEEEQ